MSAIPAAVTASKATLFKSLHHNPNQPLLLANAYDAISARIIASLPGCKALATASYALALSIGKTDETLTLDDNLLLCRPIAAVAHEFNVPLTVDIQDGYAGPGDLAKLRSVIQKVILELGAVGVNLEDSWHGSTTGEMVNEDEAIERIKAVMQTAKDLGVDDFVVNARSDTFFMGGTLEESIRRGKRYLEEGGAETVFIFWPRSKEMQKQDVQKVIDELGGRVNVGCRLGGNLTSRELGSMGAARVSVGPQVFLAAAEAIKKSAGAVFGG
ncbi:phosphoenolpyruvate phosphomutase-domain-containing protein [Triangularia verruculosa]|uniref:Phosphoenolpyruvate phosphomutase-domain-containing protein n=1 Tax=Triangularia verruculosa TaxID=2587418 RepID=A0AAN6XEQ5_9PEZI|nr:phosphoenolpyruvate phosphomutase-domain-containing protein [Triangularia verruculosa]